jgi:hypothetical protein
VDGSGNTINLVRGEHGYFLPGNRAALGNSTPRLKRRITYRLHEALDEIDKGVDLPFDAVIARKVRDLAVSGDMRAIEFISDRVEGKVSQGVEISGPDRGPIEHITREMTPAEAMRLFNDALNESDAGVVDVEPTQEAAE